MNADLKTADVAKSAAVTMEDIILIRRRIKTKHQSTDDIFTKNAVLLTKSSGLSYNMPLQL